MQKISRQNNFDLIRLFAASQVLFWHGCLYFGMFDFFRPILTVLYLFPGVPIFFTISGFLIYHSFESSKNDLSRYLRNRFLRIFPALWVCTLITFLLFYLSAETKQIAFWSFTKWLIAQLTFFQFYTIQEFKSWGVGHPNGSLWTITVEIQFYLMLPLFSLWFKRILVNKRNNNFFYLFFLLITLCGKSYLTHSNYFENATFENLYGVTILSYFHHFCIGILIYLNFDFLKKYIENKAMWWLIAYGIYVVVFKTKLNWFETVYDPSFFGFIGNILLSFLTVSFAFTLPTISQHLLKGNDISYGIYIYHMPLFNFFLELGKTYSVCEYLAICLGVCFLAFASWRIVEKPLLKLKMKRNTLQ